MKALKQLLNGITTYLRGPSKRRLYAVTGGKYLGEFFVYMEKDDKHFYFLSLPKMYIREVPLDKYQFAIDNKILDKVQNVPRSVWKVCNKQYVESKQSTHK